MSAAAAPVGSVVRLLGALSSALPNKLLIFLVIFAGGIGLCRFVRRSLGLATIPAIAAGTLFCVNPYVLDRLLAGQLLVALGYAVLPWALPSFLRVIRAPDLRSLLVATAWTVGISFIDLHAGGMALLLLLTATLASTAPWPRRLLCAAGAIALLVGANLFWILPSALAHGAGGMGGGDLIAYAPRPSGLAILPHEIVLEGFWRIEFNTPLAVDPAVFLTTFLPLLAVAFTGFVLAIRSRAWRRPAIALGFAAAISLVLGMGISFGPTAWLTRFLFDHFPGYGIFREPQKWIGVLALADTVFFAVGAGWLLQRFRQRSDVLVPALVLLPIAATRLLFWGMAGAVHPSTFPGDWDRAEAIVAAHPGPLLALPWNEYEPVPFADNRTIVNPATDFFSVPVLVSQNPQLLVAHATPEADSRTRYVSRLLESHSEIRRFGHLMARLGIRYVGLEHVPDFSRYGFLKRETDLRPVLVGRTFTLYENLAWRGGTYGLQSVIPRAQHEIGSGFDVSWLPVWHRLRASKAPFLGTDRSCADGWRLGDQQPICELGAVAAFRSPRSSQKMWRPEVAIQALGYLLSAIVLGLLALSMRRKRSTRG